MLHEFETPRNRATNILADEIQHVGDRRINRGVWRAFTASETGTGWNRSRSIQRALPISWTHAALFHLGGETGHVGEAGIAALPGSRCIRNLPAVVDHHERPVLAGRRQIGSQAGIAQHILRRAIPAIGVVPVVAAVASFCRKTLKSLIYPKLWERRALACRLCRCPRGPRSCRRPRFPVVISALGVVRRHPSCRRRFNLARSQFPRPKQSDQAPLVVVSS